MFCSVVGLCRRTREGCLWRNEGGKNVIAVCASTILNFHIEIVFGEHHLLLIFSGRCQAGVQGVVYDATFRDRARFAPDTGITRKMPTHQKRIVAFTDMHSDSLNNLKI